MKTQRTAWPLALLLMGLATLGTSAATAQTELFFATGVDSTGRALAQSNADGYVLIESPQYPRGLWLHLVDEAGDVLAGLQVEYQGRADSLVAIYCVDPTGGVRETLIWTRPEGTPLSLMLKPKEADDLPTGLIPIHWQIDPTAEALLEPMAETWRINWEEMAAFLKARWQGQAGRIAVQIESSTTSTTWAVEVLHEGVIFYRLLFADANLESAVRETLGRPQGRLTPEDVASLKNLNFHDKDIHSLAGIEYLTALQGLSLRWNQIIDITPLNQLTSLRNLYLGGNQIVDITPLNQLTSLKRLGLSRNQIVDITPLNQLTFLRELALDGNQIIDITPLNQLTNLQELALGGNQIIDITPLHQLTNLQELGLSRNQIVDLTPLNQLTNLQELTLGRNQIVDITPLNQLTNLQWLYPDGNQIVDLTPLNQLTNLQELGLSRNQIVDLTPLNQLTNLQELWLGDNQIEDLAPLVANAGLGKGDSVNLQNNPLRDQALNEHIPSLQARGVSVSY